MRPGLLAASLAGACLLSCTSSNAPSTLTLDRGILRYEPGGVALDVELPEYWDPARRGRFPEATYELPFRLDRPPDELWAVYLPRLSMNAAVYVNGHFVGDGGRLEPPISRNQNRPLLFSIPTGMLRAGSNVVQVRLVVEPTFPGLLDPVVVGSDTALRPRFDARHFFQVTLLQALAVSSIAVGLLILGVYGRRDHPGTNVWFAASLFLWAVGLADSFLRDPPLPARAWEWLGVAAMAGLDYCLVRAFHLLIFERRRVARERLVLAILAVPGVVTALVPDRWAFAARVGWQFVIGGVAAYVLLLVFRSARRGVIRHPGTLSIAAALAALLVGHDLVSIFGGGPMTGFWLTPYAASVTLLYAGWTILASLADSLTAAERLNLELEERVRQKHAELEANYQRLRALEREHAVASERERIMQDVHDGIGGQLVSTLALVESGRGDPGVVADSLHEALDDLRLIIDSLEPEQGDLAAALGTMRVRLEPRLMRHGIAIDWQVQDVPPIDGFGPEQALQVLRIVQEAIANVMKHADARRVGIRTGTQERDGRREAYLSIEDDGRGIGAGTPRGRGLANMKRRAESIGGTLEVESDAHGTHVRLRLPL